MQSLDVIVQQNKEAVAKFRGSKDPSLAQVASNSAVALETIETKETAKKA